MKLFTLDTLRPYQSDLINKYRTTYKRGQSVCLQAPTGTGKTPIIAGISYLITKRNKTVWIVVPRNHLEWNTSEHLKKWQIVHGIFNSKLNPSKAYNVHVVSKDTLVRRINSNKMGKILHPDYMLIDECHIAIQQQIQLHKYFCNTEFIGLTATPESSDAPMSDMWDVLIESPSIKWFIDRNYLSKIRYFSPPFLDVHELRLATGKDYTEKQIETLFAKQKKIYGDVISTYRKYCHNLPAICFTGSVKLAYETAQEFNLAGYKAQAIDGGMSKKDLKFYLSEFKAGNITILVNCMIATYGLDLPNCMVGLDLAPTKSIALYLQKFGRVIRPIDGKFKFWFDFVNNADIHNINGLYYHEVDKIEWNFDGRKKKKPLCENCKLYFINKCNKIARSEITGDIIKDTRNMPVTRCKQFMPDDVHAIKKCPFCFVRIENNKCPICGYENKRKGAASAIHIDAELVEHKPLAVSVSELPAEEKRLYHDRVNNLKSEYISGNVKAVEDMITIAKARGHKDLWVYHQLNDSTKHAINAPLLHEMARIYGYSPKKVWFWKGLLEKKRKL